MLDREVTKLNVWYLEYYIPYCRVFFLFKWHAKVFDP